MRTGRPCGDRRRTLPSGGLDVFIGEDGGYTSVAVALALLVSLSLTCSLVSVAWLQNRSADVQAVADSTALAGTNVVASYATVATVLDSCVLTLGLAGMVTLGAGLVVSAIPGMAAVGASTVEAAGRVLDARGGFARSAAKGLKALEATLPLAIACRSAAVAQANEEGSAGYTGVAIPFPTQSQSDFSGLDAEVDASEAAAKAAELQQASERAREADARANEAKRAAWRADCVAQPRCLRERADVLAGLDASQNPSYAFEDWTFGAALVRARSYYAARLLAEAPLSPSAEELTNSAVRRAFYEYALGQTRRGRYEELGDGRVEIELPSLPANTEQMRQTTLYTEACWPSTNEQAGPTLHSTADCAGARGASAGYVSLSQLDAGSVRRCGVCRMDSSAMGSVAAASTSIDNGFEHYWKTIVDESERYEAAREDLAEAQEQMRGLADEGASAFDRAMQALAVPRPKLCPPGAWGCVAVVTRGSEAVPSQITSAFLEESTVPAGAAVSAATLAPDGDTEGNDVLVRSFEALSDELFEGDAGVLGSVGALWSRLLEGYGAAMGNLDEAAGRVLDGIDGVFGTTVGSWLRDKLKQSIRDVGLEPADLRLRKPVVTNSQNVLDKAGYDHVSTAREFVGKLPDSADPSTLARALGQEVANELGEGEVTIAEIPIPGTDLAVPLTIDVGQLLGAA